MIGLRILVLVCLHFHAALSHGEDQGFESVAVKRRAEGESAALRPGSLVMI